MTTAAPRSMPARLLGSPGFWIAVFVLIVIAGLVLPMRVPLGANYWDTEAYLDAIHRIRLGQQPNRDFFAPVGPLGYWLAAGLDSVFTRAQPMLLVNWAILPVALPVLLVIVLHVGRASRPLALALLLPFLVFAALPVNLHSLYPAPGLDGFGHYNRHVALLLYLLTASLLFVRSHALLAGLVAVLMLALALVKITGAVSGAMLVGYAVLAGRLRLRDAILAAAAVLAVLGLLDLATGIVRAYIAGILLLISLNTGLLLPRILTVASVKFNVIGPCLALGAVLALAAWREHTGPSPRRLLDAPLGWLAVGLAALGLFETQNTGSLEFIGLWPVLLTILVAWRERPSPLRPLVLVLVLATALPSLVIAIERGARALLGAPTYVALPTPELGAYGRVGVKGEFAERAATMLAFYATHREVYRDLAGQGVLPSSILYSEIDYQATWLLEARQAVLALPAWEQGNGRRLASLFTLDFVDPVARQLGRDVPRHVAIGIDPSRSNPPLTPAALAAMRETDAILAPACPPTPARRMIAEHFAPALQGRTKVALAPCWDMYLKP